MGPIHCVNAKKNLTLTTLSVNKTSVHVLNKRVYMTCTFSSNLYSADIFIAKLKKLNIFHDKCPSFKANVPNEN